MSNHISRAIKDRAPPAGLSLYKTKQLTNENPKSLPPQKELLILWTLRGAGTKGIYGLDIQRAIEESSRGAESISHGTLYSLLKRLRNRKYIDSYEGAALGGGAKRHYYYLTEQGKSIIRVVDKLFDGLKEWKPE